jgi:hypothetical protein
MNFFMSPVPFLVDGGRSTHHCPLGSGRSDQFPAAKGPTCSALANAIGGCVMP